MPVRRWDQFEYNGETRRYRESWGDVAGRWLAVVVVLAVAAVPVLVAAGVAPHWAWIFF